MIRRAKPSDITAIMRLLFQVNNVHAHGRPDLFRADVTKYTEEEVLKIIADPSTPVFILAEDDTDEPMAYCFCLVQDHTADHHLQPVKTLYIDDLCVDENCRGRHLGSKLYEYVKEWAKENGFYNITLNVWSCNPSAARFYESMGLLPQKTTLETLINP